MPLPSGAFAPVPTPLDSRGAFDPDALHRHLSWLAEEGLDGVLVLGTNGEFPSFTLEEKWEVAHAAASETRLQKILCIGSTSLPESLELARLAVELDYDAVLCPPPYYFRAAPVEGLADYFRAVLEASELPVLLYHFPAIIGVPISDELLVALGAHEKLVGIKDSTGEPDELARLAPRFANGCYLVGSDRTVEAGRRAGGKGCITAAASVVPRLVKAVQEGSGSQSELDGVRVFLEEFGLGPAVKAILRHRGFGAYATRPPLRALTPNRERELLDRVPTMLN